MKIVLQKSGESELLYWCEDLKNIPYERGEEVFKNICVIIKSNEYPGIGFTDTYSVCLNIPGTNEGADSLMSSLSCPRCIGRDSVIESLKQSVRAWNDSLNLRKGTEKIDYVTVEVREDKI